MEKLEPLTIPLDGINLIEASAGTGKTYTITTLFLRLIIEKKLLVDKILVVTFTEAATEELRHRIRRRLREALTAFQQPKSQESKDEVLAGLIARCEDKSDAILRLTNALRGFDEAAIFTIHSFCRQMLQDNAFESGVLFDTELVDDQSPLLREIVEDFWRQHFYNASQLFITYALEKREFRHPSGLLTILKDGQYIAQPFLKIIPSQEVPYLEAKELGFYTAFLTAQQTWRSHQKDIQELLLKSNELKATSYKKDVIPQWCQSLDGFFNAPVMSVNLPDKFIKFMQSELEKQVKKGKTSPRHDFFLQCDTLKERQQALVATYEQLLLALKIKLFDITKPALARKKQQLHILSFDDLLINLHQALIGNQGPRVAQLIRQKYHAALIDEFQDTDPVQYEIFHTIYGAEGVQPILFLIGDPKQAIYSFRGADIFTYMAAARGAEHRYTLGTNWRSEPDLMMAINQLFSQAQNPFLFAEIGFQPVDAPTEKSSLHEKPRLKIENKYLPPLQFWFVPRYIAGCPPEKPINKGWAKQKIPWACANEIARLLGLGKSEQALIGEQPLMAGDIAVLVRTNAQALQIQQVLTHLQIPSVLYSRDSLLHSHEIIEIERILLAVAEPYRQAGIKAALTTDMIGLNANELHELMANDALWQAQLNRFEYYHFLWQQAGFIQMYRSLLLNEQVPAHLLSYPDGERRLTNVLHAGELLQKVAIQQKLSMTGLCQWLAQQRHQPSLTSEEQQLRLESDEKRVKIVTIHKSKGLEYSIIFCPFIWDGYLYNIKDEQVVFHDTSEQLTLDLGSAEQTEHRLTALTEEQAENLRLFYVAVTRAKHRCYLVWGAFKEATSSPLAHLLHPWAQDIEKTDDAMLLNDLKQLAANSGQRIYLTNLPADSAPPHRTIEPLEPLHARPFKGQIDRSWQVSSFTALVHQKSSSEAIDRPDYDETPTLLSHHQPDFSMPTDQTHIFNFPRGARAGNLMHALFEHLDFKQPAPSLIQQQLSAYGFEVEKWSEVIWMTVNNVLQTPLEPKISQLTLSQIDKNKRLNELEFYYPITRKITPGGLHQLLRKHVNIPQPVWQTTAQKLTFSPRRGFMKGYIDMIFEYQGRYYLVDYKSNMLGTQQDNYHHQSLIEVMMRENYLLQYHLYAIALHRYLSLRLPHYEYQTHFGGVYYLFLRGIRPEWGPLYGIYRDRPQAELIQQLSNYLQ